MNFRSRAFLSVLAAAELGIAAILGIYSVFAAGINGRSADYYRSHSEEYQDAGHRSEAESSQAYSLLLQEAQSGAKSAQNVMASNERFSMVVFLAMCALAIHGVVQLVAVNVVSWPQSVRSQSEVERQDD